MNVTLTKRAALRMPPRIREINRHNWIERMPAAQLRRIVVAANFAILALVLAAIYTATGEPQ